MAALTEDTILANENGDTERETDFNVEEELPAFLQRVLDRAEYILNVDSRNINEIQTFLVVIERTVSLLRLIRKSLNKTYKNCSLLRAALNAYQKT